MPRRRGIRESYSLPHARSHVFTQVRRETCACRKSIPDILMMQSASTGRQRMCPARSTARRAGASLFNDKCVRVSLLVFHVTQQHVTKMAFAYYDHVIGAFPADRTDQPFSISVLP